MRISSHCALLFVSLQGLWDLSCQNDFRRRPPDPVAVEQLQAFVEPLPTPPPPAEALSVPSPPQVTPNLLLHPVSNEAEALAGMPNRKVIPAKWTVLMSRVDARLSQPAGTALESKLEIGTLRLARSWARAQKLAGAYNALLCLLGLGQGVGPGFGYSTRPRTTIWTPVAQARLLHDALRQLGVESAVVVGHSWGTLVAVALGLNHKQMVKSLILLSGFYFPRFRLDVLLALPPAGCP